ncbi:endoglucanase II [Sodiomyces alkalinus F11]|uniref:lytic cellulose monooxygenase (C4-dehydrogenating) n=1 Tax=Sodiomyces alkalinus (strain CBS 110278 / VKM F-3762 / F11) TaxID=1314773 RepID=A0A3N2Q2I3_SODAK|nr:endoglucanase II [Sodiomyces alkalinus F11]ROT40973.1 endoglucanase II [Sodiomyces alkalinus F11]
MKSALTLLASASLALGHATFQQLWVNGADHGTTCARLPRSNSPVENVNSQDLTCNVGGRTAGHFGLCQVPAGATVTVEMHEQPNDRDCNRPAIGGNHFGPVIVYMSAVNDATTADGSNPWFKVAEFGYSPQQQLWGTDVLNENCGHFNFVVPAGLPSGDYLVRAEAIALHVAGSPGGAQFYMTCYQITVTNGGGSSVPSGVSIPGAYTANHPGILINIWTGDINNYVIPGPPVVSV